MSSPLPNGDGPEGSLSPGDANKDGIVNEIDLEIALANLGTTGNWEQGDFNGDGLVGEADIVFVILNWQGGPIDWDEYTEYRDYLGKI